MGDMLKCRDRRKSDSTIRKIMRFISIFPILGSFIISISAFVGISPVSNIEAGVLWLTISLGGLWIFLRGREIGKYR